MMKVIIPPYPEKGRSTATIAKRIVRFCEGDKDASKKLAHHMYGAHTDKGFSSAAPLESILKHIDNIEVIHQF